jgi:hypothetical protein
MPHLIRNLATIGTERSGEKRDEENGGKESLEFMFGWHALLFFFLRDAWPDADQTVAVNKRMTRSARSRMTGANSSAVR